MKFLRKLCQVLLIIVLVVLVMALHLVGVGQKIATKDFIVETAKNIDITEVLSGNAEFEATYNDTVSSVADQAGIGAEAAKNILESEPVKEVVGEVVGSIVEYNLTGNEESRLSAEDFVALVEENIGTAIDIAAENGFAISEDEQVEILETIRTELPKYEAEIDSAYEMANAMIEKQGGLDGGDLGGEVGVSSSKVAIEGARMVFSPVMLVVLIGLILLGVGLVILVRWSWLSGVFSLGAAALIGSLLLLPATFIPIEIVGGFVGNMSGALYAVVPVLLSPLRVSLLIGVGVGIAVIIGEVVLKRCLGRKKKNIDS